MLIQITNVKSEWLSPDRQREIWGLTNGLDGSQWKTMSQQIASSEGQTMDLTTRVSPNGKTYLIQPPKEGYAPAQTPQSASQPTTQPTQDSQKALPVPVAPGSTTVPIINENTVARFEAAVEAFNDGVTRLVRILPWDGSEKIAPSNDVVATKLPGAAAFDRSINQNVTPQDVADVFDGEIVD